VHRFAFRIAVGAVLSAAATCAALAGEITVYTNLESDEVAEYVKVAQKDLPDVKVNVLRLSTGDLAARLAAESANPRNDVIWALSLTNMLDPRILALTEAYTPAGIDRVAERFKDPAGRWFTATGYMAALCVNLDRLKQKNLPVPASWKDLTHPVYKGEIVMPNPESSGTGYLQIVSLIQGLGTEAGWKMIKDLDKNVAQYPQSGSAPCKLASKGEFAIGASLAEAAIKSVKEGFPVKMVIPAEGAGYELGANALMAAAKNKADARRFLDWTLSPNAVQAYSRNKEIVTVKGATPTADMRAAGLPEDVTTVLFKMDFAASAATRGDTLKRWKADIGR
jgi:iron(III) transport system substrate-binding protein